MGCGASNPQKQEKPPASSTATKETADDRNKSASKKPAGKEKKEKKEKKGDRPTSGRYKLNVEDKTWSHEVSSARGDKMKQEGEKKKALMRKMQGVSQHAAVLSSYVPWEVLKQFTLDPSPVSVPQLGILQGVVMIVDISGFTPLAEQLSKRHNMYGVELLVSNINKYFSPLITLVAEYGGSIEKFAGDALIILYGSQYTKSSLESLCQSACSCALAIQRKYPEYEVSIGKDGEQNVSIGLHIGISAGEVKTMTVGGLGDSWRRLVCGPAVSDLNYALPAAKKGQVVVTIPTAEIIKDMKEFDMRPADEAHPEVGMLLTQASGHTIKEGKPLEPVTLTTAMERGVREYVDLFIQSRLDLGQNTISETRQLSLLFIGINNWLSLQASMNSVNDASFNAIQSMIRSIQMFVYRYEGCIANCLVDEKGCCVIVTYGIPQHDDDPLRAIRSALEIREKCEQLSVGVSMGITTGEVFIGTIGSEQRRDYTIMGPPVNLAARLMTLCESVRDKVEGVTTSNNTRHKSSETSINIASGVWSHILVDEATFHLTKKTALYNTSLPSQTIRGCEGEVSLFIPMKLFKGRTDFAAYQRAQGDGEESEGEDDERALVEVGRAEELQILEKVRNTVVHGDPERGKGKVRTSVVLVYGEGGMGKSYLIRHCAIPFEKGQIPGVVLESAPDCNTDSVYGIWESIYIQLLCPQGGLRQQVLVDKLKQLSTDSDWMELSYLGLELNSFLALLNPVLKTSFQEPQELSNLGPAMRAHVTKSLLHIILKILSKQQPLVLLFDDMHNCRDVPSLELLCELATTKDREARIMVICSLRDEAENESDAVARQVAKLWQRIRTTNNQTTIIHLKPLSEQESGRLIAHLLNKMLASYPEISEIKEVDQRLAEFIYSNSQQGRTFLLVAIANAIRDELISSIKTSGKHASIAISMNKLHIVGADQSRFNLNLPKNVTHFARSTIDRLPTTQQICLKYAAIIGKKFTIDALQEIFPAKSKSRVDIVSAVLALIDQRLVQEAAEGDTYRFVDSITQEEAYSMILHEERVQIHKKLGEWLEQEALMTTDGTEDVDSVVQLSRHWSAYVNNAREQCTLEEVDKALWYLRRNAQAQQKFGDYHMSMEMLQMATSLLPIRKMKSNGDDSIDIELEVYAETVLPINKVREKYSADHVLKLHDKVLAIAAQDTSEQAWEVRFRAACGRAVELATIGQLAEAKRALSLVDEMTMATMGGQYESMLRDCTHIRVKFHIGDKVKETLQLIDVVLDSLSRIDLTIFSTPKLHSFFMGLSSGCPTLDLYTIKQALLGLSGRCTAAEGVPDVAKAYNDLPSNTKAVVEEARMMALSCQYPALVRDYTTLAKIAENALETATKANDVLSVLLATFFIGLVKAGKDSPDEGITDMMSSYRTLHHCLGPVQIFKYLLLDTVVAKGGRRVMDVVEIIKEEFAPEAQYASGFLRLTAEIAVAVYAIDPLAAEDIVLPYVTEGNLTARVFASAEMALVRSINLCNTRSTKLLKLRSLCTLYNFWSTTWRPENGLPMLLGEIRSIMDDPLVTTAVAERMIPQGLLELARGAEPCKSDACTYTVRTPTEWMKEIPKLGLGRGATTSPGSLAIEGTHEGDSPLNAPLCEGGGKEGGPRNMEDVPEQKVPAPEKMEG